MCVYINLSLSELNQLEFSTLRFFSLGHPRVSPPVMSFVPVDVISLMKTESPFLTQNECFYAILSFLKMIIFVIN